MKYTHNYYSPGNIRLETFCNDDKVIKMTNQLA